jgi:hypothetical protein
MTAMMLSIGISGIAIIIGLPTGAWADNGIAADAADMQAR